MAVQGWAEAMRNDAIRDQLAAHTARVVDEIARLIARGQRHGQFKADADPQAVARSIVALFRGLTLQAAWDEAHDPALVGNSIADMLRGALLPVGDSNRVTGSAELEKRQ